MAAASAHGQESPRTAEKEASPKPPSSDRQGSASAVRPPSSLPRGRGLGLSQPTHQCSQDIGFSLGLGALNFVPVSPQGTQVVQDFLLRKDKPPGWARCG